jgi:predicted transposase YbfD/YdcC
MRGYLPNFGTGGREMEKEVSNSFENHFGKLKDPRINRKKLYPLVEVLFVVLCGSICGAESWRDFVLFGKAKLDFLRQYYEFKNGIASKNTYARVFAALDTEAFKLEFVDWVKSLQAVLHEVIAIDGKTLCNSLDKGGTTSAIHMVSAFATEARLVLAQQKVDEKSNEITAIPKLLSLLDLKGHTVTIDAMGTQKAIAKQIIDQGGDYVLALKGNQGTLNEDVRLFLETELEKSPSPAINEVYEDTDKGHGRIEIRSCFISDQVDWLHQKEQWAGLKTIAMIEETQETKGKSSTERRFFISSLPPDAKRIASAVRSHWLIENGLHWTLDVVFNEDQSRVRKDNAGENMALIRHITINMLNSTKKLFKDISLKALRKKAGWDTETLGLIFRQNF